MAKSNKRKLYRSKNDKVLAGIFGGLGEYFDIDSNLLRIIVLFFIFLTFFGGLVPFLIVYFVAMFIIPSNREVIEGKEENSLPCKPVYRKWWFWLIIIIFMLPIILVVLGIVLFAKRTAVITDNIDFRQERVIIERPREVNDHIIIYQED